MRHCFIRSDGFPFKVTMIGNKITIRKKSKPYRDAEYDQIIDGFNNLQVKKILISDSPNENDEEGNTILVNTENNEYVFISGTIKKFTTTHEIVKLWSPIENNGYPYPYAIDTNNNIYLLTDNVIIRNGQSILNRIKYTSPYLYYYNPIQRESTDEEDIESAEEDDIESAEEDDIESDDEFTEEENSIRKNLVYDTIENVKILCYG